MFCVRIGYILLRFLPFNFCALLLTGLLCFTLQSVRQLCGMRRDSWNHSGGNKNHVAPRHLCVTLCTLTSNLQNNQVGVALTAFYAFNLFLWSSNRWDTPTVHLCNNGHKKQHQLLYYHWGPHFAPSEYCRTNQNPLEQIMFLWSCPIFFSLCKF